MQNYQIKHLRISYGLLGPSGCGKTTLLTCVVGIRQLDSGDVMVLGGKPGTQESGVPGPRIGYMPQEVALVQEFTTAGALYYFGRINGMDDKAIGQCLKLYFESLLRNIGNFELQVKCTNSYQDYWICQKKASTSEI